MPHALSPPKEKKMNKRGAAWSQVGHQSTTPYVSKYKHFYDLKFVSQYNSKTLTSIYFQPMRCLGRKYKQFKILKITIVYKNIFIYLRIKILIFMDGSEDVLDRDDRTFGQDNDFVCPWAPPKLHLQINLLCRVARSYGLPHVLFISHISIQNKKTETPIFYQISMQLFLTLYTLSIIILYFYKLRCNDH